MAQQSEQALHQSQLPQRAQVVIIGAGIIGSSVAWHLADRGWRDILLLEQGPLPNPGGSTGHASNFVFPVDHAKDITQLTVDSLRQYTQLDVLIGCGGIEVARSAEREQEFWRRVSSAKSWGVDAEMIGPDQIRQLMPYCNTDLLRAGFYTPSGAIVDPIEAGAKMRTKAQQRGALTVCENTEVTGLDVVGGRIRTVHTSAGDVETDQVIVACGVWSPKIAAMAGVNIPLSPAVHQMIDVGPIDELKATGGWIDYPLIRDIDNLMYERQRGADLEIGSYAHRPLLHRAEEIPAYGTGSQPSPTSFPFTAEDFAPQLAQARELFPTLLTNPEPPIVSGINGLLSVTPDGHPLIGPVPDVAGLFCAASVWIKEAPAVGKMVAEWLTDGATEVDPHAMDITRFYPHMRTEQHIRARVAEGFPKIYGIVHPREQWDSNRPMRTSPFYPRELELGAVFFEAGGWERPQWYESNASLVQKYRVSAHAEEWDSRWWSPIIEAEHLAMRESAAMIDLSAFVVIDVTGPGALDYLQGIAVAQMDRPVGRSIYTAFLAVNGGFHSDLTIVRRGEENFRVITGAADGGRDLAWLRLHLPDDGSVQLTDMTSALCTIGVWGPRARDVIASMTEQDVSDAAFGFGTAQDVVLDGVPTSMLRISYVGDLGWEIYAAAETGLRLWDALAAAGAPFGMIPAGAGVYGTTGRLEKAHRLLGAELSLDYNPVEASLALPKVKSADFIGKAAYLAARDREPAATLCTLAVTDPERGSVEQTAPEHFVANSGAGVVRYMTGTEPILTTEGEVIEDALGRRSYVTSAGPAPSLGKYLLLAYLPPEHAHVGTRLAVEYLGERYPIAVLATGRDAPFDPDMSRVKR